MPTTDVRLPGPGDDGESSIDVREQHVRRVLGCGVADVRRPLGSVDHFDAAAFGPLCESTDVYRTSIKVGDGRKKGFQYDVASSSSEECL